MLRFTPFALLVLVTACTFTGCGRSTAIEANDAGGIASSLDAGPLVVSDAGPQADAGPQQPVDSGVPDAGVPDAGAHTTREVTVLTINLWHDFPNFTDLDKRTQMVADFVLQRQPDFVAAQEAGENGLIKNRCKVIAEKAGYQYRWVSEGGFPAVFAEGPCVLSRWPVMDDQFIDLPHPQQSGLVVRKAQALRVQWPGGPLTMISTHLSNGNDAENDRVDQAVAVYQLARQYAGPLPVFMGGDLNSSPTTPPMKFLRGEQTVNGVMSTMKDAWLQARPNDPGLTASAGAPDERIDYLYMDPGTHSQTRVIDCEVVLNQPTNGVYPSDHYGVLCRFEISTPAN